MARGDMDAASTAPLVTTDSWQALVSADEDREVVSGEWQVAAGGAVMYRYTRIKPNDVEIGENFPVLSWLGYGPNALGAGEKLRWMYFRSAAAGVPGTIIFNGTVRER